MGGARIVWAGELFGEAARPEVWTGVGACMLAAPLGARIEHGGDEASDAFARMERAGLEPVSSLSWWLRLIPMDRAGEDVTDAPLRPLVLPRSEGVLRGGMVVAVEGPPPRRSERGSDQAGGVRGWAAAELLLWGSAAAWVGSRLRTGGVTEPKKMGPGWSGVGDRRPNGSGPELHRLQEHLSRFS